MRDFVRAVVAFCAVVALGSAVIISAQPVTSPPGLNLANAIGVLGAAKGGTGLVSYAVGDILTATATTTIGKIADVAVGSYMRSGGVSVIPLWSTLTLPNTATTGDLLAATSTNAIGSIGAAADGNVLRSAGTGTLPVYDKVRLSGGVVDVTGTLPPSNGGLGLTTTTDDAIVVGSGTTWESKVVPSCSGTLDALNYNASTNVVGCNTLNIGVTVLQRNVTQTEVVNTVAETALYTYTIPGGTLSTDRQIRITLDGDFLNNTGVALGYIIKLKYGATTFANLDRFSGAWFAPQAARRYIKITATLTAQGATNSQNGWGENHWTAAADGTSIDVGFARTHQIAGHNAIAEDSTANKDFVVTITLGTASTNMSFRKNSVLIEVL